MGNVSANPSDTKEHAIRTLDTGTNCVCEQFVWCRNSTRKCMCLGCEVKALSGMPFPFNWSQGKITLISKQRSVQPSQAARNIVNATGPFAMHIKTVNIARRIPRSLTLYSHPTARDWLSINPAMNLFDVSWRAFARHTSYKASA